MSYTRMNYIEYVSEEIADELEKYYTVNGPKNFPDALCLVFLRTGPTTAALTSVYPTKEAYDRATEQRKKAMKVTKTRLNLLKQTKELHQLLFSDNLHQKSIRCMIAKYFVQIPLGDLIKRC